jgi:hypothetical protein
MSIIFQGEPMKFVYTRSNDDKDKMYICSCNLCGSHNLIDPHSTDVDHRDVQGFYCGDCGHFIYYHDECKTFYFIDDNGKKGMLL